MNKPIKKGKEVIFVNKEKQEGFTLRNQERELYDFRDIDIEDYLADMFVTPGQFVVLTAPEARNKIRFVQSTLHNNGDLEVELGIEEDGTRLYYKMCSEEECYRIFLDFYDDCFTPDLKEYKPVEFL